MSSAWSATASPILRPKAPVNVTMTKMRAPALAFNHWSHCFHKLLERAGAWPMAPLHPILRSGLACQKALWRSVGEAQQSWRVTWALCRCPPQKKQAIHVSLMIWTRLRRDEMRWRDYHVLGNLVPIEWKDCSWLCLRNERTKGLTKPEIGVKLVLQALRPLGYIGTWEPEDDETTMSWAIWCLSNERTKKYVHNMCIYTCIYPPRYLHTYNM